MTYKGENMTTYIVQYDSSGNVKAINQSNNQTVASGDISTVLTQLNNKISDGDTISINDGTYSPDSQVVFNKSIILKTEGAVFFNWSDTGYNNTMFQFNGAELSTSILVGDVSIGSNTITVSDVGNAQAGYLINIYDNTIWNPADNSTGKTAELHEISSISGNTITIKDSTINTFTTANNGTVIFIRPIVVDIDGITVNGPGATVTGFGIGLKYTKDSIIQNSKFQDCGYTSVNIERSYYTIIENNIIGDNYQAGDGYGIAIYSGSAHTIMRNNNFYHARHAIATGVAGDNYGVMRDTWVIGNIFNDSDGTSHVIDSHNGESYYIYNNTIYSPSDQYAIASNAKITKIIGNTIIGGYGITPRGICVYPGFDIDISNNKFINTRYIYRYNESTDLIYKLNIQNNTVTGNIQSIAVIYNANLFDITGNQFSSTLITNGEEIIYLLNSTKGIISNNIISNAYSNIIRLASASNYNLISNNTFVDWDTGNGYNRALLIQDSSHNTISNNVLSKADPAYGIQETGTSDYNKFLNNDLTAVGSIVDRRLSVVGTNTQINNNTGYITENNVLSNTFSIDSTGIKTIIIPHGLAIKPKTQDCCLTIVKNTNVTDWRYNLLLINYVDSKNVAVNIYVSTPSRTVGATARLTLKIGGT